MKKHKVLLALCGFVTVVAGCVTFWILLSEHHEHVSKQLLREEVGRLPLPPSCAEQYHTYQRGGLDANSSWHVVYKCNVVVETAKDAVASGLTRQGFTAEGELSQRASHFKNSDFKVDYNFIPDSPSSATISLNIYREGRSY